jgi:hypothetical protein
MLSITIKIETLSITLCGVSFMLNFAIQPIVLIVVILSVVMLIVDMLSALTPRYLYPYHAFIGSSPSLASVTPYWFRLWPCSKILGKS